MSEISYEVVSEPTPFPPPTTTVVDENKYQNLFTEHTKFKIENNFYDQSFNFYKEIIYFNQFYGLIYAMNISKDQINSLLKKYDHNFFKTNSLVFTPNHLSKITNNQILQPTKVDYYQGYVNIIFKNKDIFESNVNVGSLSENDWQMSTYFLPLKKPIDNPIEKTFTFLKTSK